MKDNLIIENTNLIYYVLNKMNLTKYADECYDIGLIGLCKAANTYNSLTNVAFTTYAYHVIKHEISHHITHMNTSRDKANYGTVSLSKVVANDGYNDILLEDVFPSHVNVEEEVLYNEMVDILNESLWKLKPKQRTLLIYYYGLYGVRRLTQKEIAIELHLSRAYVNRLIKQGERSLRKMMEGYVQ